jgi:flagellar motor switch protein FliG
MCTKWFSDGAVHEYFNPYGTPYDAFINYMNVLSDFIIRVENAGTFSEDFNDMKETASKMVKKGKKFIKEKAGTVSKKVEETIIKGAIKFEDIKEMSDDKIKKLIKESDLKELAGALKDAEAELIDKIIPNLSKKAKKSLEELQKEMKIKKAEIKKYRDSVEKKLREIFD